MKPQREATSGLFLNPSTSLEKLLISRSVFTKTALKCTIGGLGRLPPYLQSVEIIHDFLEWSPINAGEELPQPIKIHLTIKEKEK